MGPPPPGTLLGILDASIEDVGFEFPATAAATTRVRAAIRIISFINRSPLKITNQGEEGSPLWGIRYLAPKE
jgi:hypothetical protein